MTLAPPGPWSPLPATAPYAFPVDMSVGQKAAGLEGLGRSVVDAYPRSPTIGGYGNGSSIMLFALAQAGEAFVQWGVQPFTRDAQLRNFFHTEPFLASAVGIIASRNAAMNWKVNGAPRTAKAGTELLQRANFGAGWEDLIGKVTVDLLTQDKGAFVELVREYDSPEAPVLDINSLDSQRCHLTGVPDEPVWYEDARNRFHRMRWYNVVQLLEMPSPFTFPQLGHFYRLQYSAVTRLLRAAQIIKSTGVYNEEKISGRFQRGVHIIQGVTAEEVRAALVRGDFEADQASLTRYMQPAIVGSMDPKANVDVKTLELASLPSGWDEDKAYKWYLTAMAMALLTDYQEFAPLPGGGLGTSAQSEVLHMKSRGKGQGLFMELIARLINMHGVLPRNVEFEWDEQDIEADKTEAENADLRAKMRAARITSGEITTKVARRLAVETGDLSPEQADELDLEEEKREREEAARMQEMGAQLNAASGRPGATTEVSVEGEDRTSGGPSGGKTDVSVEGEEKVSQGRRGMLTVTPEWSQKARGTVPFGDLIISRLHRMYSAVSDDASGLGYFPDLDDRLAVANGIGPALAVFADEMRKANVYDIPVRADDADRIVEMGLKATDPEGPGLDDEEARIAFEGVMADEMHAGLQQVQAALRARLTAGG